MFIEFTQDYRDFVQNNGASEDQSQGMVVEYRTDDGPGPMFITADFYTREDGKGGEINVGQRDLGTLDELNHAVFEDHKNKNEPRFWLLGSTGTPARTKTASGERIIDAFKNNDDFFEYWIGAGLGSFQAIFGDDSAEKYIGISGDQVYATELDAKADSLPGYPKPIADAYPGVGEKDIYVNRGCANPFANNYGAISEGDNAGTNPVADYKQIINNADVGDIISWPLSILGEVKIHTSNQPPSFTEIRARRTKTSLLKTLDSPTYTERRTLGIPNIDGGNCDFSVSNDQEMEHYHLGGFEMGMV